MLTVLSVNLQNNYGDQFFRSYARMGHSQAHILGDEVASQALHYGANVICTQEDEHGLAMPRFEQVAAACAGENDRKKEVVRTYVQEGWLGRCMHAEITVPRSDACPLPTRCGLIVQLPSGHRVANVFLAGGRHDDQGFLWHQGCADARVEYTDRVLAHEPDIIVGDWNADVHAGREEELYTQQLDYVRGILRGVGDDREDALKRWLVWRQSPFPPSPGERLRAPVAGGGDFGPGRAGRRRLRVRCAPL